MEIPVQNERSVSPSTVELIRLLPGDLAYLWPLLKEHVRTAVSKTEKVTEADVCELGQSGDWQIWVVWNMDISDPLAVFATELAVYPSGHKVARINLAGGVGLDHWKQVIERFERWARDEGCDAAEICGRRGWGKIYPDYALIESTFSKELGHGERRQQ